MSYQPLPQDHPTESNDTVPPISTPISPHVRFLRPCFAREAPETAQKPSLASYATLIMLSGVLISTIVVGATSEETYTSVAFTSVGILSLLPTILLFYLFYWRKYRNTASLPFFSKLFLLGWFGAIPAAIIEILLSISFMMFAAFPLSPATRVSGAFIKSSMISADLPASSPSIIFNFILFALFESYVVAGLVEEGLKLVVASRMRTASGPTLWHPRATAIYGLAAGLGFATFENLLYLVQIVITGHLTQIDWEVVMTVIFVGIARDLLAVPLHALTGMLIGHGYFKRIYEGQQISTWRILLIPIAIHGSYDFFIMIGTAFSVELSMVALFLDIMIVIVGFSRLNKLVLPKMRNPIEPVLSNETLLMVQPLRHAPVSLGRLESGVPPVIV